MGENVLDYKSIKIRYFFFKGVFKILFFSKTVKSGLFREVADMEHIGRLIYREYSEFPSSVDTLVRPGDHVLVDLDVNIRNLMAHDFSRTGSI